VGWNFKSRGGGSRDEWPAFAGASARQASGEKSDRKSRSLPKGRFGMTPTATEPIGRLALPPRRAGLRGGGQAFPGRAKQDASLKAWRYTMLLRMRQFGDWRSQGNH